MIKYETTIAAKRFAGLKNINLPTECPVCKGDISINESGIVSCINPLCDKKVQHKFDNAFRTLEIKGAGPAFFENAAANVKTLSELFTNLKSYNDWAGGVNGNKVAEIVESKKKETVEVATFFALFDIPGFGVKKIKTIEKLWDPKTNTWNWVKVANTRGWTADSRDKFKAGVEARADEIADMLKLFNVGSITNKVVANPTGVLEGISFCFTGAFPGYKRADLQAMVTANGGILFDSVKAGLSFLVQADPNSTSSKSTKAKKLGTAIIGPRAFLAMVDSDPEKYAN